MFLLGRIRERRTARDKIKRKGKEEKNRTNQCVRTGNRTILNESQYESELLPVLFEIKEIDKICMCQTLFYIKKSRYVSKNSDRFGWLSDRNDRGRGRRCRARDMT